MQASVLFDDRPGLDPYHFPVRKTYLQTLQYNVIVCVIIQWDQHGFIDDQKIGITGR